jgi:ergothioneine biosynthesis protein EgtB
MSLAASTAPAAREDTPRLHPQTILEQYRSIRNDTESLCRPLATEDYVIQGMPDVSPPKWHLAHSTWFFENFLLIPCLPDYRVFHPQFGHLFNSYYESIGNFFPRPQRGLLSRPTVAEIYRYRSHVDHGIEALIAAPGTTQEVLSRVELGLNHEQQHQELLLTDIKYNFALNPLHPVYQPALEPGRCHPEQLKWLDFPAGLRKIGHQADYFAFDNETPRHAVYLNAYRLASRLVSNGEFLEFVDAGGYQRAEYWLSDGWAMVRQKAWQAPLYWQKIDGAWWVMTLGGLRKLDHDEPVSHVSYYEADAYARWRGRRLPSEAEWEWAAAPQPVVGNLRDTGYLHPVAAQGRHAIKQLYGDVWEWTASPYQPYPGFRPLQGSLGEYNGKFMCNQMVLRGGSCVTPKSHIRSTYRNFFYPADRWQFSGIRLADDGEN